MKNLPVKTCPVCKKEFTPTRQWQIYCNPKCQQKNFNSKRNEYLSNLVTKLNSLEAENEKLKDECNRLHKLLQIEIKYRH